MPTRFSQSKCSRWLLPLVIVFASLAMTARAVADEPEENAEATASVAFSEEQIKFFQEEVKPILEAKCFKCHGGGKKIRGDLRLTSRAGVLRGGELGPAVSLDDPAESQLLRAINYEDLEMPPTGKLAEEQIAVLTRWVKSGLPWTPGEEEPLPADEPDDATDTSATDYWAYQPVERPAIPSVQDQDWPRNPIDAFILHRLEEQHLQPSPPAPPVALLRRLYYDLTGLAPTPEEIAAYLEDDSPLAYEQAVDRLLASPAYGEKWGRHWLDLVRYAETNGYERDGVKDNAWRYRDYVIDSFNADKPYDRFIMEQLAGDELDDADAESLIATGYYRLGLWDDEPVDADQAFFDSLDDVVSTTGSVFLGMSIGCARCHDHKGDPIPQRDYYRLLAFFANTYQDIRQLKYEKTAFTLNTQIDIADESERQQHTRRTEELKQKIETLAEGIAAYEERILAGLSKPEQEDARDKKTRQVLIEQRRETVLNADEVADYVDLKKRHEELQKTKLPPLSHALAIKENGPQAPETFLLVRGNVHSPGEQVEPGLPAVLDLPEPDVSPPPDAASCFRRLALARLLTDPANPLTARVLVNRVWQYHFGRGIVGTTNDFGHFGQSPTHPELLDYLASALVDGGWSLKRLHRMILTSNVYCQSSGDNLTAAAKDPTNELLWRFNMRRLSAEEIRDSILAVNGTLNREMSGPSIYTAIPAEVLQGASRPDAAWGSSPAADAARRSIYVHVKRSLVEPVLQTFDLAESESSCARRFTTTVPTQSLTMLNGEFFVREAARFARRLEREAPGDPARQVALGLELALCREPAPHEVERGVELLTYWQQEDGASAERALEYFCLMVFNLNEFVYLD